MEQKYNWVVKDFQCTRNLVKSDSQSLFKNIIQLIPCAAVAMCDCVWQSGSVLMKWCDGGAGAGRARQCDNAESPLEMY